MNMCGRIRLLLCAVIVIVGSGCGGNLADVKPFADATAATQTATNKAFESTATHLVALSRLPTPNTQDELANREKEVKVRAEVTTVLLKTLVDYADLLSGIVKSATERQKHIDDVSTALNAMTKLAPAPLTEAEAAGIITAARYLGKEFVIFHANHTLREAMEDASPRITTVVKGLETNLNSLEEQIPDYGAVLDRVNRANAGLIACQGFLLAERDGLTKTMKDLKPTVGLLRIEVAKLQKKDPKLEKKSGELAKAEGDLKAAMDQFNAAKDEFKGVQGLLQMLAPECTALNTQRSEMVSQNDLSLQLLSASRKAILAWKEAHNDLSQSLGVEQTRTHTRTLNAAVKHLTALVELTNRQSH